MSTVRGSEAARRRRLAIGLALITALAALAGLAAGSEGWSLLRDDPQGAFIVAEIRAPRTLGAWLTGALFGLGGAIAQGLFRNPLADPFLLGSASGASFAVVLVLASASLVHTPLSFVDAGWLLRTGIVGAAFVGAFVGVGLTLLLSRGAEHTTRLLLAGVVVGVVLGALSDLVTNLAPETLRGRQVFVLGTTGFLGWPACLLLACALAATLPPAWRLSRVLDALTLGEDGAASLGIQVGRMRVLLVALLALATGAAVAQAGLVAFVGLVSPHLARRFITATHGPQLLASAAIGGALLLVADVAARSLIAPAELPVGILTAVLGGFYLLWLLNRPGAR
ncbi:MAG TPA: iron ABC transporter permease [Burkholderiaceae bacterium]|nr:iron ABC transporter permease [Burkholderiaceae bacterium]